jgi:hypothetical protein
VEEAQTGPVRMDLELVQLRLALCCLPSSPLLALVFMFLLLWLLLLRCFLCCLRVSASFSLCSLCSILISFPITLIIACSKTRTNSSLFRYIFIPRHFYFFLPPVLPCPCLVHPSLLQSLLFLCVLLPDPPLFLVLCRVVSSPSIESFFYRRISDLVRCSYKAVCTSLSLLFSPLISLSLFFPSLGVPLTII